jgi:hypothetical protein
MLSDAYRAQLEAIYREHNPRKLHDIDSLLQEWSGREDALLAALGTKYLGASIVSVDALFELMDKDRGDTISYGELQTWWRSRRLAGDGHFAPQIRSLVTKISGADGGELDRAGLWALLQELMSMDEPERWSDAAPPEEVDICKWLRLDARHASTSLFRPEPWL